MKIEIESQDIERIAQRVLDLIKPILRSTETNTQGDAIFDVRGLAEYLQVDTSWVYKQTSLKAIPHFKTGKYPKFRKRDIDRWIEGQSTRVIPPARLVKDRGRPADSMSNASKKTARRISHLTDTVL